MENIFTISVLLVIVDIMLLFLLLHRVSQRTTTRKSVAMHFMSRSRDFNELAREKFSVEKASQLNSALCETGGLGGSQYINNGDTPGFLYGSSEFDKRGVSAALAETAITADVGSLLHVETIKNIVAINKDFLAAVKSYAGKQFTDASNIFQLNQIHEYAASHLANGSISTNDAIASGISGHYAERIVGHHLESLGHKVEFPDSGQNPGYDLLADGHPFQVKCVSSAGAISRHFDKYPDIPVIAPSHFSGHEGVLPMSHDAGIDPIGEAMHQHGTVVSDLGLDHGQVKEHTERALHGIADVDVGSVHHHMPWITVAFSGYREAKLLYNQHTKFDRAAKNIALDAAGTGIGGTIGAVAGVIIGTIIDPGLGTVVGKILGGIGGAMLGRNETNKIKYKPLDDSKTELYKASISLKKRHNEMKAWAEKEYETEKMSAIGEINRTATIAQRTIGSLIIKTEDGLVALSVLSVDNIKVMSNVIISTMLQERQQVQIKFASLPLTWRALLTGPAAELSEKDRVIWKRIKGYKKSISRIVKIDHMKDPVIATNKFFLLTLSLGYAEEDAKGYLNKISDFAAEERSTITKKYEEEVFKIAAVRATVIENLRKVSNNVAQEIESSISPFINTYKGKLEIYEVAARSFGLDV